MRPGRILTEDQVADLCEALERARERERSAGREYDLLDPGLWPEGEKPPPEPGKSVGFLFNLWLQDGHFREVCFNPTLALWSSQLIGSRQVRLLEDGAIFKEPGGKGGSLKWHQDYAYWPIAMPAAATAWIALDHVTLENGAMKMAVGSHLTGERLPGAFGTGETYFSEKRPATVKAIEDPEELGMELDLVDLEPGEVSLHHPLTWHASGPNTTDRPRRAFVVRYAADGAIWLGSRRYEYNYADDEVGIAIGEPLGGRYFPIVPSNPLRPPHPAGVFPAPAGPPRGVAIRVGEDVDADVAGVDDSAVGDARRDKVGVAGPVVLGLAADRELEPALEHDAPLRAVGVLRDDNAVGQLEEHAHGLVGLQHPRLEPLEGAVRLWQGPDELGEVGIRLR